MKNPLTFYMVRKRPPSIDSRSQPETATSHHAPSHPPKEMSGLYFPIIGKSFHKYFTIFFPALQPFGRKTMKYKEKRELLPAKGAKFRWRWRGFFLKKKRKIAKKPSGVRWQLQAGYNRSPPLAILILCHSERSEEDSDSRSFPRHVTAGIGIFLASLGMTTILIAKR